MHERLTLHKTSTTGQARGQSSVTGGEGAEILDRKRVTPRNPPRVPPSRAPPLGTYKF